MTTQPAFSLARRLRAGETVYSGWCGLPSPIVAELVGREGFPAVTLDGQHGLWDTASVLAAVAQVRQGGAAPIVRIPVGQFATASRALDFGAEGIIAPMINTPADAGAYVSFAKFPPVGERSWGPHRATTLANMPDQKVYLREANDLTAVVEAARLVPDVEFVLMGDGKRRAELERTAPPNVHFRSGSKTDVARLAAESSVCLTVFKDVPVLATNSPNKLFDTFAAGRAAIVNMDGWMRELVERDGAGVYVRAGDARDLAEKVARLRDNPDEVRRMGENARALAEREFGRDELAGRALAVLEEAAR